MHLRVCFALLFWVSACASAPPSLSPSRSSAFAFAPAPPSYPRLQFVSARTDVEHPPIAKADLEQARALLLQARNDLEPRQWEALAGKLTAAERAFERFSQATKASGQAAEVVRGAEGIAQASRARAWVEVSPRVGPLLVFLVLLDPSSTAGPEIDRRPEWVDAQGEYEARLREVAEESRRLMGERALQDAEPDFDSAPLMAVREPKTWRNTENPATGRFYTSVEEYDRIPRYPDQTCKNSHLDKHREQKFALYKAIPPLDPRRPNSSNKRWYPVTPCSRIRLRLAAMQKVLDKREEIRKDCFGGKSDPGHDQAIDDVEQGIENLKPLEATNCAPGHLMADK
ncbi:hypothetical protein [Archangium primigenium]|uniref:hypothetical protein n=1 Tax=[Archangium] primigenium TaxID=2792470 RepID=UPI001958A81E|nr:hypothetical protein [Archangium primigenium]MBM7113898.1 hypothetical protein [Archangium primigenium]